MLELYFLYIFPFFSICQDAYSNVNSLYIKFLYKFFLPDVASASIAGFKFVSLVLSVPLTVVENDCITNNTLSFYYIYYIYEIYSNMLAC